MSCSLTMGGFLGMIVNTIAVQNNFLLIDRNWRSTGLHKE